MEDRAMPDVPTMKPPGDIWECEFSLLSRVLALSTSALSYWGRDGVCRFANHATEEWFGVHAEFVVGCRFEDFIATTGLAEHRAHARAAQRGEVRSIVQSFRHAYGMRIGLVRYLPDLRNGVTLGFVMQVSVTPAELQLDT
jgi:PAS domain S-box-containing protein